MNSNLAYVIPHKARLEACRELVIQLEPRDQNWSRSRVLKNARKILECFDDLLADSVRLEAMALKFRCQPSYLKALLSDPFLIMRQIPGRHYSSYVKPSNLVYPGMYYYGLLWVKREKLLYIVDVIHCKFPYYTWLKLIKLLLYITRWQFGLGHWNSKLSKSKAHHQDSQ